ncbi:hypothetical protein GGR50DRAFT_256798 [Xylaria sp. CBS 124048]|nr:hypothetical protein GGR50DRAFT_256798 [Xylaria sp. CBS 124048]
MVGWENYPGDHDENRRSFVIRLERMQRSHLNLPFPKRRDSILSYWRARRKEKTEVSIVAPGFFWFFVFFLFFTFIRTILPTYSEKYELILDDFRIAFFFLSFFFFFWEVLLQSEQ